MNAKRLEAIAQRLEVAAAVELLLGHLFPKGEDHSGNSGRCHILGEIIADRPWLFQALMDRQGEAINQAWSQVLMDYQGNIPLHHTLAVLYREQAMANRTRGQIDGHLFLLGTAMWAYLLTSEEFWDYFAGAPLSDASMGERPTILSEEAQKALFHEALQDVLIPHSRWAGAAYASSRSEEASLHLQCLNLCRLGDDLLSTLEHHGLSYAFKMDRHRQMHLQQLTEELLDNLGLTLIKEAEKLTDDPEVIRQLPKGIRKNYAGGIRHLEPFIHLRVPVVRVLRICLDWYNEWCYDLYVTQVLEHVEALMEPSSQVADQLIPQCIKARGHRPENQTLSQHFLLRGYTCNDPEQAVRHYEEALAWNPGNENAKSLLDEVAQEVLSKQLKTAIKCMERKQFRESYEILDTLENQLHDKDEMRKVRAVVCFQHAQDLANDLQFREGLKKAQEAKELEPEHPVIQEFLTEMEELAPEEDNLRRLHNAEKDLDKERYDRVIQTCSPIPDTSKFYDHARQLQAAAYFRRAIAAANKEHYEQAEKDLKCAIELVNDPEARQTIAQQLSVILNAHAVHLIEEVQELEKHFGEALDDIIQRVKKQVG